MKLNKKTKIVGKKVILIPYESSHVPTYHKWMQDPENLELTASEPLSLDEEYAMQRKWREDEDKCTFIITSDGTSMIGDVNLFLVEPNFAELEVMIGTRDLRGKGFGTEAIALMIRYGRDELKLKKLRVKILQKNAISIRLFEKFGFQTTERSEVFQEVTMELEIDEINDFLQEVWSEYRKCACV